MAFPIYRFGDYRLDPASRELWLGDEQVALPRRAFDCLVYLVEHRDRAIERDELFAAVWGDVQLSDGVLAQAILEARRALGDTGEEQRFIKTVRHFGYHWGAPVVTESAAPEGGTRAARRPLRQRMLTALFVIGAVMAAGLYLWRSLVTADAGADISHPGEGSIALLLPVEVESGAEHAWVRLGLMDLIAGRLRAAGQAMVPSDTVIVLAQGYSRQPTEGELQRLTEITDAHLVLAARARASGSRWTVSLHSLRGASPPLTAVGEAYDVLAAGRAAADQMTNVLGLSPADEPDVEPALTTLLQRVRAAALAQEIDEARGLIERAPSALRRNPETRLTLAVLGFHSHELGTAERALESLLEDVPADGDPELRARILNALAAVHGTRGDSRAAVPLFEEAARLFGDRHASPILGTIRMNLGIAAQERGDFPEAHRQMAQARRILQGIGDVRRLAYLEGNIGVLEGRQERWTEALGYFESAADRFAAIQDVGGELRCRALAIQAHLQLLDLSAASAVEPRVRELLGRTSNPELVARAGLSRVYLLNAQGRHQASKALLRRVLTTTDGRPDLLRYRADALALLAEQSAREGETAAAVKVAREVVELLASDETTAQDDARGRAWLTLVRAELAQRDASGASMTTAALADWANRRETLPAELYAALAQAEVAASAGEDETAAAGFEHALALAETTPAPARLLEVAQSYVPWLLAASPRGPDPTPALLLADRLAQYADEHYEAALLQLRLYHALGPPSTWRTALTRARTLSGEREIPPELLVTPRLDGVARAR